MVLTLRVCDGESGTDLLLLYSVQGRHQDKLLVSSMWPN